MRDSCAVTAMLKTHSGISVHNMQGVHRFTSCAQGLMQYEE